MKGLKLCWEWDITRPSPWQRRFLGQTETHSTKEFKGDIPDIILCKKETPPTLQNIYLKTFYLLTGRKVGVFYIMVTVPHQNL